jgi:hypothetical protein
MPSTDDTPSPPQPESLEFMRAVWALAHSLERASKRMLREVDGWADHRGETISYCPPAVVSNSVTSGSGWRSST